MGRSEFASSYIAQDRINDYNQEKYKDRPFAIENITQEPSSFVR